MPGAGEGRAWRRLETEHFQLTTDLAPAAALDAAGALERTRAALLRAAWSNLGTTRQTERVHVVVLANELECQRLFGPTRGLHARLGGLTEAIVLSGPPSRWESRHDPSGKLTTSVLRHEMTHHLAAGIYGRQPRWFAEGLAQFLETLVIDDGGKKAILGRPNAPALRGYESVRSLGVSDALAWGEPSTSDSEAREAGLYGLAWIMVHWMWNMRPAAFASFQQALARGDEAAFAHSFGDQSPDAMDQALYAYRRSGVYAVDPLELTPLPEVHPTFVPFGAADAHALRGQLALIGALLDGAGGGLAGEVAFELSEALRIEPGNVTALRLLQITGKRLPRTELLARLREQTRQRPDDGEAWLFMGSLLHGAEREAALRRALALLPGSSRAHEALALYLVQAGRGGEALPLATRAAVLAPWSYAVLDTLAACLHAVGRCPDAVRAQVRAVDNLPERATPAERRPFMEALARYRDACAAAGQGAPP